MIYGGVEMICGTGKNKIVVQEPVNTFVSVNRSEVQFEQLSARRIVHFSYRRSNWDSLGAGTALLFIAYLWSHRHLLVLTFPRLEMHD